MNKGNFYKKKCEALEIFYGWIDQGSEYNIAVEQSLYYNPKADQLDEIIINITIATRFARCGKRISDKFKDRLEKIVHMYKNMDIEKYDLSNEELSVLDEEVQEIEGLIQMNL